MDNNLLELVMIVKNSGEVLRKCLQSIKPYIDRWSILDTGSVDNTPDIIIEEMKGVDGNLYKEPFIDFSTTRNRSLELASGLCKYIIILDDSYEFFGGKKLRKMLKSSEKTSFSLKIGNIHGKVLESYYYSLRIIKTSSNLRYQGRVHEFISDYKETSDFIRDDKIFINDMSDNDHTVRTRLRQKKDIDFLLMDLEDNPNDPRTLMYLCKTYIFLKNYEKAIEYFDRMETLGKSIFIDREYQFFAKYEKACLEFGEIDYNVEKFKKNLLMIQKAFPERAEAFYKLSTFLYESGQLQSVAKIMDKLIHFPIPELYLTTQETLIYDYYIPYVYIDVNLKLGNFDKAVPKLREMLDKYPFDQPLLNIKYAICDKSGFQIESLSNKRTLVIHTGSIGMCWDPKNNTKISGSEYMAMNMAKEFVKLGYRTFIFGSFEDEEKGIDYQGIYEDIQYIDYKFFPEFSTKYIIDYLIVSRFISNLVYYDNIFNVWLWVHDVLPHVEKNSPLFQTHAQKFRGIIVLSKWHRDYVLKHVGMPEYMSILSRNAIYNERFLSLKYEEKVPFRFIYMSDAFRGLHYLVDMLPKIKEKYPQTTLQVYTRIEHVDEQLMNKMKELDYIDVKPRISQELISKELMKSDIWLYPTDFEETYCISALEAMASGCLVATVKYAGLIDTVGDRGIMCESPISDKKNQEELLKKLFFVLDNPSIKQRYIDKAREWAMAQTYKNLAKEWVEMFKKF